MKRLFTYDVVVVGGGSAGVSAAIGARKCGLSVALIERNPSLGGQATNANVAAYCGFFTKGDTPKQVVKGVGQEFLDQLSELGAYSGPKISPVGNAIVPLDIETTKFAFDTFISKYEIDLFLHCRLIEVNTSSSRIETLICVDDEGKLGFEAKQFIDCSGEANLAFLAGAKTVFGNGKGNMQMATQVMQIEGFDPNLNLSPALLKEAIAKGKEAGIPHLSKDTGIVIRSEPSRGFGILASLKVPSLDCRTLTECEMNTRRQIQSYMKVFREFIPGMETCKLVSTGPKLGIRETRHIVGTYTLSGEEVLGAIKSEEGVASGAWPCEIHEKENEMAKYLYVKENDYYHIPLGSLKSASLHNLWCAGRVISVDPIAFASVRVMGIGFATGHAAGVAAALTVKNKDTTVKEIREELITQNAVL